MAAEGVIEMVRAEQQGSMPARTVYAITPPGRFELVAIRDQALRETRLRPNPVDLALQNAQDMSGASVSSAARVSIAYGASASRWAPWSPCRPGSAGSWPDASCAPSELVTRLQPPFERLSPVWTGTRDGTGLGLSIVSSIARAHGPSCRVPAAALSSA
jgi:hypothetical protein